MEIHRGQGETDVGQTRHEGLERGRGQLPPTALPALASIAVESNPFLDRDVAGSEGHHLRPPAAGQDEGQEDRAVPPARDRVRDRRE
jgi:hypothetical protein